MVGGLHAHIPDQNLKWRFTARFNSGDFSESTQFLDSDLITDVNFELRLVRLFFREFFLQRFFGNLYL